MKYGIPSLMEFSDVESHAAFCAKHGFSFVELNMTYPWFQADALDPEAIRAAQEKYGVGFTIHLHDQLNPLELCDDLRKASITNILRAVELSQKLSIPRITMHLLPGMYSSVNGTKVYIFEKCISGYLALAEEFRQLISGRINSAQTAFCIENTSGFHAYQRQAIELLLESPCFGLTYDIGHDAKTGYADESFVLSHQDRLRHLHMHDSTPQANHLALGEGNLDIPKYLALAEKLDCTVVAEVKESGALVKSEAYLRAAGKW